MTDIKPRWYSLSREGMATLCKDEEDARANAAHCDQAWPNGATHSAVQLVPVADVAALVRDTVTLLPPYRAHLAAQLDGLKGFLAFGNEAGRARTLADKIEEIDAVTRRADAFLAQQEAG